MISYNNLSVIRVGNPAMLQDLLPERTPARFSYRFAFIPFFVHSNKPKTRIEFAASSWSGNEKHFCFALRQRYAKFSRF